MKQLTIGVPLGCLCPSSCECLCFFALCFPVSVSHLFQWRSNCTISMSIVLARDAIPQLPPYNGPTVKSLAAGGNAAVWVLTGLALIVYMMRIVSRMRINANSAGWDDVVITISMVGMRALSGNVTNIFLRLSCFLLVASSASRRQLRVEVSRWTHCPMRSN